MSGPAAVRFGPARRRTLGWLGAILAAVGVLAAARAGAITTGTMDPEAVERWCSAEQQGAHQLAEELRQREHLLEVQEKEAALQSAELQSAQTRLDARMTELTALRAEIDARLAKADAERQARIAGLVKMVEANRPPAVAPMFAQLDPELAVEVLDQMNRSKAGKLLAALPPAQAAALAQRMTAPLALGGR